MPNSICAASLWYADDMYISDLPENLTHIPSKGKAVGVFFIMSFAIVMKAGRSLSAIAIL